SAFGRGYVGGVLFGGEAERAGGGGRVRRAVRARDVRGQRSLLPAAAGGVPAGDRRAELRAPPRLADAGADGAGCAGADAAEPRGLRAQVGGRPRIGIRLAPFWIDAGADPLRFGQAPGSPAAAS